MEFTSLILNRHIQWMVLLLKDLLVFFSLYVKFKCSQYVIVDISDQTAPDGVAIV